jgi:3'(2'), 5'-bisphosphate nucleotidase
MNYSELLSIAKEAALEAGDTIMQIQKLNEFEVLHKEDNSPVTTADFMAHQGIQEYLKSTKLPILSEEGEQYTFEERKNWETFWMVDPLDGTKGFINGGNEFAVNIALIENRIPVLGVIYQPSNNRMVYGGTATKNVTFWQSNETTEVIKNNQFNGSAIISRKAVNQKMTQLLNKFQVSTYKQMSSSAKFIEMANGEASIYPRFEPCYEWDTAAGHALLLAMDKNILSLDDQDFSIGQPLEYNKPNLLNPPFIAI